MRRSVPQCTHLTFSLDMVAFSIPIHRNFMGPEFDEERRQTLERTMRRAAASRMMRLELDTLHECGKVNEETFYCARMVKVRG